MKKDARTFIKNAERRGWRFVRYTGSGHYMMKWIDGTRLVFPSTPGKSTSFTNARHDMARVERGTRCSQRIN